MGTSNNYFFHDIRACKFLKNNNTIFSELNY
jgi:hypothetical protein